MSTILETPPQVRTTPEPVVTAPKPTSRRRVLAIVAAVVAGLAVVALVVAYLVSQTTSPTASTTDIYGAYGPGTTVYSEQVPTVVEPYPAAYTETFGKGSPMYRDQITYPAVPLANIPQASAWSEWPPATVTLPPTVAPRQVAPFE